MSACKIIKQNKKKVKEVLIYLPIETIGRPSHQQRHDVCDRIRWNSHELSIERRIPETGDDGGDENRQTGKGRRDEEVELLVLRRVSLV